MPITNDEHTQTHMQSHTHTNFHSFVGIDTDLSVWVGGFQEKGGRRGGGHTQMKERLKEWKERVRAEERESLEGGEMSICVFLVQEYY